MKNPIFAQIGAGAFHFRRANAGAHRFRSVGAFTLSELLVAASLTMILATTALSLLAGVLTTWQSSTARADAYREARAALFLLKRELNAVVPATGTNSLLRFESTEGNGTLNRVGWLTRLAPALQPTNQGVSDVCAVIYFTEAKADGSQKKVALYRQLVPSDVTFEALTGAGDWFDPATLGAAGTEIEENAELVAANVVSFAIQLLDDDLHPVATTSSPATPAPSPSFLEVRLQVVGQRDAEKYFEKDVVGQAPQPVTEQGLREFTFRHRLP